MATEQYISSAALAPIEGEDLEDFRYTTYQVETILQKVALYDDDRRYKILNCMIRQLCSLRDKDAPDSITNVESNLLSVLLPSRSFPFSFEDGTLSYSPSQGYANHNSKGRQETAPTDQEQEFMATRKTQSHIRIPISKKRPMCSSPVNDAPQHPKRINSGLRQKQRGQGLAPNLPNLPNLSKQKTLEGYPEEQLDEGEHSDGEEHLDGEEHSDEEEFLSREEHLNEAFNEFIDTDPMEPIPRDQLVTSTIILSLPTDCSLPLADEGLPNRVQRLTAFQNVDSNDPQTTQPDHNAGQLACYKPLSNRVRSTAASPLQTTVGRGVTASKDALPQFYDEQSHKLPTHKSDANSTAALSTPLAHTPSTISPVLQQNHNEDTYSMVNVRKPNRVPNVLHGSQPPSSPAPTPTEPRRRGHGHASSSQPTRTLSPIDFSLRSDIGPQDARNLQRNFYNALFSVARQGKNNVMYENETKPKEASRLTELIFHIITGPACLKQVQRVVEDYTRYFTSRATDQSIQKADVLSKQEDYPIPLRRFFKVWKATQEYEPTSGPPPLSREIIKICLAIKTIKRLGEIEELLQEKCLRNTKERKDQDRLKAEINACPKVTSGQGKKWKDKTSIYIAYTLGIEKVRLDEMVQYYGCLAELVDVFGNGIIPVLPNTRSELNHISTTLIRGAFPLLKDLVEIVRPAFDILEKHVLEPIQQGRDITINPKLLTGETPFLEAIQNAVCNTTLL